VEVAGVEENMVKEGEGEEHGQGCLKGFGPGDGIALEGTDVALQPRGGLRPADRVLL
jgi:hypothetical protein